MGASKVHTQGRRESVKKKMDTGGRVSMTASVEDRMQDDISPLVHLVK